MATQTRARAAQSAGEKSARSQVKGKGQVSVDRQSQAKTETDAMEVQGLGTLVAVWTEAAAQAGQHSTTLQAAKAGLAIAQVYQARAAYLVATHPQVLTAHTRKAGVNATGAATVLGVPRTTLLPYIAAGEALAKAKLVNSTEPPTTRELEIVDKAMEKAARAGRRASNARNAAKPKREVTVSADPESGEPTEELTAKDGITFDTVKGKVRELTNTLDLLTKATGPLSAEQHAELSELLGLVSTAFAPAE